MTKLKEAHFVAEIAGDARLYALMARVDSEFAADTRAAGCECGGKLHSAKYPRQPRGGPSDLGEEWCWRFSFCCANDGCRKRATPPSLRFLGRRVYLGAVVVLLSAITLGVTAKRAAQLRELVGVSVRTLERWRDWWQETFPLSQVWKEAKAVLYPRSRRPVCRHRCWIASTYRTSPAVSWRCSSSSHR